MMLLLLLSHHNALLGLVPTKNNLTLLTGHEKGHVPVSGLGAPTSQAAGLMYVESNRGVHQASCPGQSPTDTGLQMELSWRNG